MPVANSAGQPLARDQRGRANSRATIRFRRQAERENGPSFLLRGRSPGEKSESGEDEVAKDSDAPFGTAQGELCRRVPLLANSAMELSTVEEHAAAACDHRKRASQLSVIRQVATSITDAASTGRLAAMAGCQ